MKTNEMVFAAMVEFVLDKWAGLVTRREVIASIHLGEYDGNGAEFWIDHEHGIPGPLCYDAPAMVRHWYDAALTPFAQGAFEAPHGFYEPVNGAVTCFFA